MHFEALQAREAASIAATYARFPLAIDHGQGAVCYGIDGKRYIDFTAGIGVNSLGFCDAGWLQAVTAQLGKLQHCSNLYYTQPCIELAEALCARSGMQKVFFCNSGTEANEGAIKAARKYAAQSTTPGRHEIVTLENSFHGRTLAALAATGQPALQAHFAPMPAGFVYTKANDIASLQQAVSEKTCAIMLELIQGEGGVLPLQQEFVAQAAALCARHDLLLIIDEVQTGMGRTGSLFLYEQYGIRPDIVTLAKGLGSGLPIGAILFGEKTAGVLAKGDHGSTFGGNPVACAGALEVVSRLDDAFLAEVARKGAWLAEELAKLPFVCEVRGRGLMLGLTLQGITAAELAGKALGEGLLLLTAKDKTRLLPPLNITDDELREGLATLARIGAGL